MISLRPSLPRRTAAILRGRPGSAGSARRQLATTAERRGLHLSRLLRTEAGPRPARAVDRDTMSYEKSDSVSIRAIGRSLKLLAHT